MTTRLKQLKTLRHESSEEGFTLIEFMIVATIILILAAVAAPSVYSYQQGRVRAPIEADVRSAANRTADFFTRYPNSAEILTATPACEGGAKNITGLLITVSSNQACISVWGTPTDFYVRGTHPSLAGDFTYSSKDQKYIRTGFFAANRSNNTNQGGNE